MKKLTCGLFSVLFCSILFLTSCEGGGVGGDAPSNVAGKTLKLYGSDGNWDEIIVFSSNTSASIENVYGQKSYYSSLQYKKTGSVSATLMIKGRYQEGFPEDSWDSDYSLVFTSPNQGIWNNKYTFTLF